MHIAAASIKRLYKFGLVFVVLLAALDLSIYFYYPNSIWAEIFLATTDQTPLTWVSSISLFLIAIASFFIYQKSGNKWWYMVSWGTFLFFSMDDATHLHEKIDGYISSGAGVSHTLPEYTWALLYAPFLLFALITLVYFLWKDSCRCTREKACLAVVLLAIAFSLDFLEGFLGKNGSDMLCGNQSCYEDLSHILRLIEEVLEVIAVGMLGYLLIIKYCLQGKR